MLVAIPTRRRPFLTFGSECLVPTQQLWPQLAHLERYGVRIAMCAMKWRLSSACYIPAAGVEVRSHCKVSKHGSPLPRSVHVNPCDSSFDSGRYHVGVHGDAFLHVLP